MFYALYITSAKLEMDSLCTAVLRRRVEIKVEQVMCE